MVILAGAWIRRKLLKLCWTLDVETVLSLAGVWIRRKLSKLSWTLEVETVELSWEKEVVEVMKMSRICQCGITQHKGQECMVDIENNIWQLLEGEKMKICDKLAH